jgi:type IX secretion system PorP/SprF family membrane protein
MKKFNLYVLVLTILVAFVQSSKSQDYAKALKAQAVYNHYYLNLFLINPANTGFNGEGKLLFNFRNQWAGFEGSPKCLTLGIEASPAQNMGLGGMIYSENFGVSNQFLGQVNYAYQFQPNKDMKMAFGLSGAYIQYSLDNEAVTNGNGLYDVSDSKIIAAVNGEKYFAADFGFYTEIKDVFRLGISIPHIVETRMDQTNVTTTQTKADRPFNFTGFVGAIWKMPEYRVVLEPSIGLRKISDVPFGADLNILARMMDDKLFAGFTYSYNPSWHRVAMLGGIKLERLGIFYSYDQSYLDFQNFNNGSHELTLTLDIYRAKAKPMTTEQIMKKEEVGSSKMEEKK